MSVVSTRTLRRLCERAVKKKNKARAIHLAAALLRPGAIYICNKDGAVYVDSRLVEFLEENWDGFEGPEGEGWYKRLADYVLGDNTALKGDK